MPIYRLEVQVDTQDSYYSPHKGNKHFLSDIHYFLMDNIEKKQVGWVVKEIKYLTPDS